jgi:hypothetical protein
MGLPFLALKAGIHMATEEGQIGRGRSFRRDMNPLYPVLMRDELHRQVRRRADSRGAVFYSIGIFFGKVQKLL